MLISVKNIVAHWGAFAVICILALTSCEVINPEEQIPSYIQIDSIQLNNGDLPPHNIVDAWVYLNDDIVGVYELPATIPLLAGGQNDLQIRAGIKMNGITLTRIPYPFFVPYETTTELFRDSVLTINPEVNYQGNIVWEENFENVGITLQKTSQSDTSVQRLTNDPIVFQGTGCGAFLLPPGAEIFEAVSSQSFDLPKGGSAVFLEIHYKCNNRFAVGIFANTTSQVVQVQPSLIINPKEDWNKIYINLTNEVSAQLQAIDYNIYFGVIKDTDVSSAEVYIDNIRLLRF